MQFKRDLKARWSELTDQDLQQIGGNYNKFVGKVQERYGEKKGELMKWAVQWQRRSEAPVTREKTADAK